MLVALSSLCQALELLSQFLNRVWLWPRQCQALIVQKQRLFYAERPRILCYRICDPSGLLWNGQSRRCQPALLCSSSVRTVGKLQCGSFRATQRFYLGKLRCECEGHRNLYLLVFVNIPLCPARRWPCASVKAV